MNNDVLLVANSGDTLLGLTLNRAGLRTSVARTEQEAFAALQQQDFAVVFVWQGFSEELLAAIRDQHPSVLRILVVVRPEDGPHSAADTSADLLFPVAWSADDIELLQYWVRQTDLPQKARCFS